MAAQTIYPDQFNDGMNILYKDITRYLDARFEAINRQNLAERSETQKHFQSIEQRLTALAGDVSNVEAVQKTMLDTFMAFAADITRAVSTLQQTVSGMQQEMRDGFAAQAERHNELMVRVERLERQQKPPEEA